MYSEALLGWTAQLGGQMALQNKPTFPRIPLLLASISCLLMAPGVVSSGNGTSTTTTIAPHNTWTGSQDPGSEQPLLLSSLSSPSSFSSSSSSNSAIPTASTDASSTTEDDQLLLSAAGTREETPGTTRTELEERGRPSSTAGAAPTVSPTEHGATATVTAATAATAAPGDIAPLTISPPPGGGGGGDAGDAWNSTRATASVSSSTGGWTLPTVANQSAEVARVPSPTTPIHRTPEPARAATATAATTAVDFPTASVRPTAANSLGATVATTPTGEGSPAGPGGTAVVALESSTTVGAVPTGGPESVDAASAELPPALPIPLAVTRPMRTSTAMDHQGVPTVPRPGSMRPPTTGESSPECNGTTHAGEERDTATPTEAPADVCHPNPCPGGHRCVPEPQGEEGNSSTPGNSSALFTCKCPPGWQGLNCTDDVDECIGDGTNPCPPFSACRNRRGGFVCECPVGFYQDYPRGCLAAKTFLGNITLKNSVFTAEMGDPASSVFVELQDNITRVMNETFKGKNLSYQGTTVLSVTNGSVVVSVLHLFASSSAATNRSVNDAIHNYTGSCTNTSACEFARGTNFSYSEGDVCSLAVCDERSSRCVHVDGDVSCVCRAGFFKHSAMDHVCRACENGYKLHNNACVKCPFGYYGHQCEERYLLVAVILAAMGAGLLVNLAIALSITCYRKRRLEAQRARYKDEGFQLSPYAELPRIPRAQTAWGRETYEMQDSGSTRNLLHPDESYIAPAYQSSVKMGESGQPYSVLPPGQYMYGGQHNPSYVHDDTRRRDYF